MKAQRRVLRWGVMPAALIFLVAGVGSVASAPQATADAARLAGSSTRAEPDGAFTAYVASEGDGPADGTVVPIQTGTNTAGARWPGTGEASS